jgi:glycosyltransferase involved in cell wall biosynthesis
MHCGLVNLRKGCHYLLQAFHELRLPDAELCFVGRVEPEMETFIRRWATPSVRFQDPVPQDQLSRHYGTASAFCLASIEDGFGMVITEAMACGLPILATENTGAPDIVREGIDGFIVPIRDVEALKEKILWLYENREAREAMGASALERVRSGYSWDDYGTRIAEAYANAVR